MRKLLLVPLIHGSADLGSVSPAVEQRGIALIGEEQWKKHKKAIEAYWDSIKSCFRSLKVNNFKVYQDGLVANQEIGKRIVEEAASKGSKNYALIKDLLQRGARLVKTEDLSLVKKEAVYIKELVKSKSIIAKLVNYLRYKSSKGSLLKKRDCFIAKTINETLGEGEKGVLFIGAFHNIVPLLAKDIQVKELKEREKVAKYQKIFYLKSKAGETSELSEYLAAPIAISNF